VAGYEVEPTGEGIVRDQAMQMYPQVGRRLSVVCQCFMTVSSNAHRQTWQRRILSTMYVAVCEKVCDDAALAWVFGCAFCSSFVFTFLVMCVQA